MKEMLYEVWCLKSNEDMILALAVQFKKLSHEPEKSGFEPMTSASFHGMSYDIPFTGKHEPNKLTCSQLCDFVAQLVGALHQGRRGHGFESH